MGNHTAHLPPCQGAPVRGPSAKKMTAMASMASFGNGVQDVNQSYSKYWVCGKSEKIIVVTKVGDPHNNGWFYCSPLGDYWWFISPEWVYIEVSIDGGAPLSLDGLCHGKSQKSQSKIDDTCGYPHFRKPISQLWPELYQLQVLTSHPIEGSCVIP